VLPGIGRAMAVALLLPVTYAFDPTGAFILFADVRKATLMTPDVMKVAALLTSAVVSVRRRRAGRARP
jgi:TctA family transporter